MLPISALLASTAGASLPASEHSLAAIWKICSILSSSTPLVAPLPASSSLRWSSMQCS